MSYNGGVIAGPARKRRDPAIHERTQQKQS
jgi:hypothetical protein